MKKEYYTKEAYEKLQEELEELKQKHINLKKAFNESDENLYNIETNIYELLDKQTDYKYKSKSFLERKTKALSNGLYITGVLIGVLGYFITIQLTRHMQMNLSTITFRGALTFCGGIATTLGLSSLVASSLRKKIIEIKEKKLKKTKEYTETLTKINKLTKEIEEKEIAKIEARENRYNSFDERRTIESKIKRKKEEIRNFEKDYINLNLVKISEEKLQSKPKTKVLVKSNN